jgi:hypothetical protein
MHSQRRLAYACCASQHGHHGRPLLSTRRRIGEPLAHRRHLVAPAGEIGKVGRELRGRNGRELPGRNGRAAAARWRA